MYFKKTTIFKQIFFSRGMLLTLSVVIIFVTIGLISVVGKSIDARGARTLSEGQAKSLKEKETSLSEKLTTLNTPEGQEAALRDKYPLVKPGEHVIVIIDSTSTPVSSTQEVQKSNTKNFFTFVKSLIR